MEPENESHNELESTLLWVKDILRADSLCIKDVEPVFAFLLIWNVFEGKLFDNDCRLSVRTLTELARARSETVKQELVNNVYDFFANRYFGVNGDVAKFNNLQLEKDPKKNKVFFDNKTDKEFVRNILMDSRSSLSDKLISVFLIAYRFRNNLFHGLKYVDKLVEYQRPFVGINSILKEVVETCPPSWRTVGAV